MFEKLNLLIPFGNIIRNKSIQNFIFLAIIQSSNVLISIISMPLLIQSIGVDQFGLVNLALSVIILLNILVGFGYNLSAPREVAISHGDLEALSHVVSNVFSGKVLLASLATLLILVGVFGFNLFEEYQMILVFSVLLLYSEATLPLWFFQGMEKMKLVSIANIFSKLLFLMGIVLFIHSPEQSKWVNFLMGFFGLGINLLLLVYINSVLGIHFYRPEFSAIWKSLKDNILLFFSNLASHISISGGLIILSFYSNAESLGMYSLAERIMMVVRILPALIMHAIFPKASKLYNEGRPEFYTSAYKVILISIASCFILTVGTYFSAEMVIQLLAKSRLDESIRILKILAIIPFLASLNIFNIIVFLVKDQKNLMFRTSWLTCLYMLITAVICTQIGGSSGLAFALASTEIAVFLISFYFNLRHNRIEMKKLFFTFR